MKNVHQTLTDRLHRRLRESSRYEFVKKNLDYTARGLCGEFDVIASVKGHNTLHYYEVKSHDNPGAWYRALEQFQRCERAFPDVDWKFIYVTPRKIRRYKGGN
jgi:hypothetical protein